MIRYAHLPSPLGDLLVTGGPDGLMGLYFPEHRRGAAVGADWVEAPGDFSGPAEQLDRYFSGQLTAFELPLAARGTPFQQAVWRALTTVPHGTTTTYGALAKAIGRPSAVRAVAGAVARNPISIIVPCHRVVGADGALTGYAGGPWRKRHLLDLEAEVAVTATRGAGGGPTAELRRAVAGAAPRPTSG